MTRILVGIAGSIAAYRSPDLVKALRAKGHDLRVVLTESAAHFVTAKTLETFAGGRVLSNDIWDNERTGTDHIEGARWAERVLVYGATANLIAKLAGGFCDDFLTLQISATRAPVTLCPAMNVEMWNNAATRANCEILRRRGVRFIGPVGGALACGEVGVGHIAPVQAIVAAIDPVHTSTSGLFAGKRILLSMGSMRTAIDDVRFVQNTSSGRMGLALTRALLRRGAHVTALAGCLDCDVENSLHALALANSPELQIKRYGEVAGYKKELAEAFPDCDYFISAAAVLDFEVQPTAGKLSRGEASTLTLRVRATPDFVAECARVKTTSQKIIAFALESGTWDESLARARAKLKSKGADVIIVNRAGVPGEGPLAATNQIKVLVGDRTFELTEADEVLEKGDLSEKLADCLAAVCEPKRALGTVKTLYS